MLNIILPSFSFEGGRLTYLRDAHVLKGLSEPYYGDTFDLNYHPEKKGEMKCRPARRVGVKE